MTGSSGRRRQFGVEIRGKDGFQFFEQLAALSRLAPIAVVFRQPWKRFGKDAIEVTGQRAAKFPRQAIESRVRLAAGEHAHEGRRLGLNAGYSIDKLRDESPAVVYGARRVQLLARKPEDPVLKLLDQRCDDIVLALEELIDRAYRNISAFRDQIG